MAQTSQASHTVTVTVNAIAMISVPTGNITLTVVAPAVAGDTPDNPFDATTKLQYTSTVLSGKARTITAAITAGTVPGGTALQLQAAGVSGKRGTPGAAVTLSATAQSIITAIGSCVTGSLDSRPTLTYTLNITDVESLEVATTTPAITVQFTLTDDV
jgi:hypothetical protein